MSKVANIKSGLRKIMNQDNELDFNEQPLVSVIMPCYNGERFIAEAIESVLGQTYQNWELIIINDGSTDNSEKIIKELLNKDNRIRYIKNNKNKGIPATRNVGIKASKGEYIALLDQDDFWMKEKLKIQMIEILKNNSSFGLKFSNTIIMDFTNNKIVKNKLIVFLINRELPTCKVGMRAKSCIFPVHFDIIHDMQLEKISP